MRKFVEVTVQFKFVWGLFFTASILLYTAISMALGNSYIEFIVIWQVVAMTLMLTLLHYLIFGELILKSLSTKFKIMIHALLSYIALMLSLNTFNWINIKELSSLAVFTGGYIVIYLACMTSFYIYYKATGEELNNRLTAYKEKKGIN
jgi:hypothetical protein